MSDRKTGVLQSWYPEKGWGIVSITWREHYFLHVSSVVTAPDSGPATGMIVEFDVAPPFKNGKLPSAINAALNPVAAPAAVHTAASCASTTTRVQS